MDARKGCAIMLAALLLVGGCTALFSDGDDNKSSSSSSSTHVAEAETKSIDIPDFTGQGLQEAQDNAQALGLYNLREKDLSSASRTPMWDRGWQVCSQSPTAGTAVSDDEALTFEVVRNEESCDDPDGLADDSSVPDDIGDDASGDDSSSIAGVEEDDSNTTPDNPSDGSGSSGSGGSTSGSAGSSGSQNEAPAGATARCNDGTYSYSQHRRGTCSHHDGVATWLASLPS
ncbi:DUF3761 domain-containing protein [Streptomyces sp. NPDC005271]|uniref:DUF3761 domain-containing protein n=1 Tax=unclassified Streptomyces TaxID=2593676 RepID=UPI0033B000A8